MPYTIGPANAALLFNSVAAQYRTTPHISPMISSGFLSRGNLVTITKNPAQYSMTRNDKARFIFRAPDDSSHDQLAAETIKVATNRTEAVHSSAMPGTGFTRAYFKEYVMREFVSAQDSTQADQRIIGALNTHYGEVCRGIDYKLFKLIGENNYIKADDDGLMGPGVDTTFDVDSGRTPYNAQVDLTAIDENTQHKIIADFNRALTGGAGTDISLREANETLYVFAPPTVYGAYDAAFSYRRMWDSTGRSMNSDGTVRNQIAGIITASGYTIVALNGEAFAKKTINGVSAWETYIIVPSAMSYYHPVTFISQAFRYGGKMAIDAPTAMEAAFFPNSGAGVDNDSSRFMALMEQAKMTDSDPLLLRYNNGESVGTPYYSASFEFHDLDPSTDASSNGTTFESRATIGGVRIRPHFIQKYYIGEDLKPIPPAIPFATGAAAMKKV